MNNMEEIKCNNISLIKISMMIVVVLYHSMIFYGGNWFNYVKPVYNAEYLNIIAMWLKTFHVQAFTMASGFLFVHLKIKMNKYNNYKKDIKKRLYRLLFPYVTTSVLWVIPINYFFFKYKIGNVFKDFLLCVSPSQLWFLIMLLFVFIIFLFGIDKLKIRKQEFILLYLFTTIIGYSLDYLNVNYFQISRIIKFALFYYSGIYIYKNKEKINIKQVIIMFFVGVLLYIASVIINVLGNKLLVYCFKVVEPLISILEISIIYFFCTYLEKKK